MNTLKTHGLSDELSIALFKAFEIETALPIQNQAFKPIYDGENVFLGALTGSGKTLAYLLPLLMKLDLSTNSNQVLIVAPTQELALQIGRVVADLTAQLTKSVTHAVLAGGANIRFQVEQLRKRPHILIGTTGRLLELFSKRKINGQTIKTVVFDEADELLKDKGIGVKKILKNLLKNVQCIAVSASATSASMAFFSDICKMPLISDDEGLINKKIAHYRLSCLNERKFDVLRKLLYTLEDEGRTLIFQNKSDQIERTVERLNHHQIKAVSLYSEMSKTQRAQAMQAFRLGEASVLVASDLSARGLDIENVMQIIHLDFPRDSLTYIHRSGRTGRANKEGASIILTNDKDDAVLRIYARDLGIEFSDIHVANGRCYAGAAPNMPPKKSTSARRK